MEEFSGLLEDDSEVYEDFMTSSELNSSLWTLSKDINGPVMGALIVLEFILSFAFNSFIILYSLCHFKEDIKQSSTFLLFVLSMTNLLITIFVMPFSIVAFISQEWIFGSTDYTRKIFCQIEGFILTFLLSASIDTLAVISIDRCLNIVRVDFHRKPKSWKTALFVIICLWIISALICLSPYYAPGFGRYDWSYQVGTCLAKFIGYKNYVILQTIHATIPILIIVFTSAWIFLFTRGFLKKKLKRQESVSSIKTANTSTCKRNYAIHMKKITGIFGALVFFNFLSWLPYIIVSIVGAVVGFENMPSQTLSASYILMLFCNVSNPIIHMFFRKDLLNVLQRLCCRKKVEIKRPASVHSLRWQKSGVIPTFEEK